MAIRPSHTALHAVPISPSAPFKNRRFYSIFRLFQPARGGVSAPRPVCCSENAGALRRHHPQGLLLPPESSVFTLFEEAATHGVSVPKAA